MPVSVCCGNVSTGKAGLLALRTPCLVLALTSADPRATPYAHQEVNFADAIVPLDNAFHFDQFFAQQLQHPIVWQHARQIPPDPFVHDKQRVR
jgi:hypothetical protein